MWYNGLLALIAFAFKYSLGLELKLGFECSISTNFCRQKVFLSFHSVTLFSLSILDNFVEEVVLSVKTTSCPRAKVVAELGHRNTVLVGLSSPF